MQSSSDLIAACVSVKRQRHDLIELPHTHTHIHKFIHTKLSSYIYKFEKAVLEEHKFQTRLSSTCKVLPMACFRSSILACVLSHEGLTKFHTTRVVTAHTATWKAITCLTRSATSLQHCWPKPLHHQSIIHDQKPETFGLRWLRLGEVRFRMKFFCSTLRETG